MNKKDNAMQFIRSTLIEGIFEIRRQLGISPMRQLMNEIGNRGIDSSSLHALEVFAYTGKFQTMDYASRVSSLEAWEVNPKYEKSLKQNLPHARIKIVDSFKEIKTTNNKFNFIVIDNTGSMFGANAQHCEHFDLFPDLQKITMSSATIVLSTIPHISRKMLHHPLHIEHLSRRRSFYKTNNPENIPQDNMIATYKEAVRQWGYELCWYFYRKKWNNYWYLVLNICQSN